MDLSWGEGERPTVGQESPGTRSGGVEALATVARSPAPVGEQGAQVAAVDHAVAVKIERGIR